MTVLLAKQYLEDPRLLIFHSPLLQQASVILGSQNILFSSSTVNINLIFQNKNIFTDILKCTYIFTLVSFNYAVYLFT